MKWILIIAMLMLTSCATYKVVVQDCSQTQNGEDYVCKKSIWGK